MGIEKILKEYERLESQLVNQGEEESPDEFMWNEGVLVAIDNLLEPVEESIKKMILLNHI